MSQSIKDFFPVGKPCEVLTWSKINVTLRVMGKAHNGYHALSTLVLPTTLTDTLQISFNAHGPTCSIEFDPDLRPFSSEIEKQFGSFESTTLGKACLFWNSHFAYNVLPFHIHVIKRIPWGAGLGGGSADAAALLNFLLKVHSFVTQTKRDFDKGEISKMAWHVGADVPMLLHPRPYKVEGIGELLTPWNAKDVTDREIALFWPQVVLSTKDIFSHYTTIHRSSNLLRQTSHCTEVEEEKLHDVGSNDLEVSARALSPKLNALLPKVRQFNPSESGMTGSGSAVFVFCPTEQSQDTFRENCHVLAKAMSSLLFFAQTFQCPPDTILNSA